MTQATVKTPQPISKEALVRLQETKLTNGPRRLAEEV